MTEKPAWKVIETIYHVEYINPEKISSEDICNSIFRNFILIKCNLNFIKNLPEIYLYNPEIFIFGGIPVKRFSVYLGPMFEAWSNNQFCERCDCKRIRYIFTCGGSLLSGSVGFQKSYCPDCNKFFNHKIHGSVGYYFCLARKLMNGRHNMADIKRTITTPIIYTDNRPIEQPIASKVSEETIGPPIKTLGIAEIINKLPIS